MHYCFTETGVLSLIMLLGNSEIDSVACHDWKPSFVRRGSSVQPHPKSQLLPRIPSSEMKGAKVHFFTIQSSRGHAVLFFFSLKGTRLPVSSNLLNDHGNLNAT